MRLKVLLMGGVLLRRLVHLDRPMVAEDGGSGLPSVDFISRLVRQGVLMRLGELTMGQAGGQAGLPHEEGGPSGR
jgi:hypothetical protein